MCQRRTGHYQTTIRCKHMEQLTGDTVERFATTVYTKITVLLYLLSSTGSFGQATKGQRCLSYEPSVIQLTGTLMHKVFPGPPNYKDLRSGDMPEVLWLLNLTAPICVDQDKAQPDLNPSHKKIRTIQLVLPVEFFRKYENLLGKRIIVTGTLFGAHTIHHRTPVLLTVNSLAGADQPVR
jgi:uncharacterized protein DUF4431